MKIKIQIKHYITGSILFEYEKEDNTPRDTVLEAIKQNANLSSADLSSADLSFADLSFANLSFANLRFADLSFADLSFADLSFANLSFANLSFADLSFANLSSADLSSADLSFADLSFANLSFADLSFADLSFANLSFANLRFANGLDYWWHVHHEVLVEVLTEPIKSRINYIKTEKPEDERELRLRLLKPVLGDFPATKKGWNDLHKLECNCGWSGKTIFTKKNGLVK